ncbi:hypothetical protein [Streptomyces sp. NPDC059928]|uniref:hypothetical protein n=1 Tax=unclassified Streptomyces TaxID=2593676 RepID=UPI00365B064A
MLLRALDAELARGANPALTPARDENNARFVHWLATTETALRPEPIPLARTVGFQLDMIFAAADLVSS